MKYKAGDCVVMSNNDKARERHSRNPDWYPAPGAVGRVVFDVKDNDSDVCVLWEPQSGVAPGSWWILTRCVEPYEIHVVVDGAQDISALL